MLKSLLFSSKNVAFILSHCFMHESNDGWVTGAPAWVSLGGARTAAVTIASPAIAIATASLGLDVTQGTDLVGMPGPLCACQLPPPPSRDHYILAVLWVK